MLSGAWALTRGRLQIGFSHSTLVERERKESEELLSCNLALFRLNEPEAKLSSLQFFCLLQKPISIHTHTLIFSDSQKISLKVAQSFKILVFPMSSDLFLLDESFFSDEFLDSPIELLQAISDHHQISQNPVQETNYSSSDQMTHPIFSTSPPSNQLENLSLYQTTQFQDFSSLEVKTEECHLFPLSSPYGFESFGHGNAAESVAKMMQRSFSSHSFDGNKPSFSFQPRFDCVAESPHFQPQAMSSPENSFSVGQMRRVHSAGDLQVCSPSPYLYMHTCRCFFLRNRMFGLVCAHSNQLRKLKLRMG